MQVGDDVGVLVHQDQGVADEPEFHFLRQLRQALQTCGGMVESGTVSG